MRARLIVATIVWLATVTTVGTMDSASAQQPPSDVFSTVGVDDQQAVGNARRWFDGHSESVKRRAAPCLAILEEAKALQDTAMDLYARARQPGTENASALVEQANDYIEMRSQKLEEFKDCVNDAIREDQFETTGTKGIKRQPKPKPGDEQLDEPVIPEPTLSPSPPFVAGAQPPPPSARPTRLTPQQPRPQPPRPRTPPPPTTPPPRRAMTLEKRIDDCFARKMPAYHPPNWQMLGSKGVAPDRADPFGQAFTLAGIAADRALQIDEARNGKWSDPGLMRDYLTGWILRCLWDREPLLQDDPRPEWTRRVSTTTPTGGAERRADRESLFFYGYSSYPLSPFWD